MAKSARGRPPAPSDTPLARWLDARRITRADFAQRCSRADRRPINRRVIERWARGEAVPSLPNRRLIERATRGEVPASSWPSS